MQRVLIEELARSIERKHALLVAGAGIAISATGNASLSWAGLLRSGLNRYVDLSVHVDLDWLGLIEKKIDSGTIELMIEAAQEIQARLEGVAGGQFRKWLKSTVGSLRVERPGILRAIAELRIPVATTNYDGLLDGVIGGTPATWRDAPAIQRIVRGDEEGVIHIHGYWKDPKSVVLGVSSYADAMGDRSSQEIVRSLFASHSVIFAGFGAGLEDPNFTNLRNWAREVLSNSDFPPTLLVRDGEFLAAQSKYGRDGFQVISYGTEHVDLELFLARLGERSPLPPGETVAYDWPSLQVKLNRLNRRIRREWDPEVAVSMSGPGAFAPSYCLSIDTSETPLVSAVTFPKLGERSSRSVWFDRIASEAGWVHFETSSWDVYLPNVLMSLPRPSRILIFDDRVIGGTVQTMVAEWLTSLGHEVRRAALVVDPAATTLVDWYEDVRASDFTFPWGGRRGRA